MMKLKAISMEILEVLTICFWDKVYENGILSLAKVCFGVQIDR